MAEKKGLISTLVKVAIWLTGVIVSLAVGMGLINGSLYVPFIGVLNIIAGWIVVVLTILGLILAIFAK